jgi:hypothetical protein
LEAIIEYEDLHLEFLNGHARGFDPVGGLEMGNIGQEGFNFTGFVVESVGQRPVASRENGDSMISLSQPLGNPNAGGGFASPTSGQVPNRDDWYARAMGTDPTEFIGFVSAQDGSLVGE